MSNLFQELKRRKVFRVAAVYAVVAWLAIQVADVVLPTFGTPGWVNQTLIFLFILGFPIAIILAWAYDASPAGITPDHQMQATRGLQATSAQPVNYLILVIVLLVAGLQAADRFLLDTSGGVAQPVSRVNSPEQSIRSNIILGESQKIEVLSMHGYIAISPDGGRIAYTKHIVDGESTASILDLETGDSQLIPISLSGGEPSVPQFSPSSQRLLLSNVFPGPNARPSEVFVINANGSGSRRVLSNSEGGLQTAWLSDQTLIYTPEGQGVFHTVSADGGVSTPLPIPAESGDSLLWPMHLPESSWVLYTVRGSESSAYRARIDAFDLENETAKTLVTEAYYARYAPSGHIVFMREGDLWAVAFDKDRMEVIGDAVLMEPGIEHNSRFSNATFGFSDGGRLIYRTGIDGDQTAGGPELSEFDGRAVPNTIPSNVMQGRFSPTGDSIVFTLLDTAAQDNYYAVSGGETQGSDIAVYDIDGQTLTRRTFNSQSDRPLWTPDGNRLVYRRSQDDEFSLWIMNADGSGQPEQLLRASVSLSATSFSPDGEQLIFIEGVGQEQEIKLLKLPVDGQPPSTLFPDARFGDGAQISPDGRWILYKSSEVGDRRIFVRPFPNIDDGKWMVADTPSYEAHWGPDGSLYFSGIGDMIYRVEVDTQGGFSTGSPVEVVQSSWGPALEPNFDISPDGKSILYTRPQLMTRIDMDTLVMVENWFERLKQLAQPNRK